MPQKIVSILFLTVTIVLTACSRGNNGGSQNGIAPVAQPTDSIKPPQISSAFEDVFYGCGNRAWPNLEEYYADLQILLIDKQLGENHASLWNYDNGKANTIAIDANNLPLEWSTTFNFGSYENRLTAGFNLTRIPEFDRVENAGWFSGESLLVFHETFHLFGQEHFVYYSPLVKRSQNYPIDWRPRYFRAQILKALNTTLAGDDALGEAAYWFDLYQNQFSDEATAISYTDRIEGSAEYISFIHSGLAALGCNATDEELIDEIVNNLPLSLYFEKASSESYDIGASAGLLLTQKGVPNWQSEVESGNTFLEVLLKNVEPITAEDDQDLIDSVKNSINESNKQLEETIVKSLEKLKDPTYFRVVINRQSVAGSFRTSGFYHLVDETEFPEVTASLQAEFDHYSGITLQGVDVFEPATASPCSDAAHSRNWIFPIHQDAIISHTNTERFSSTDPSVLFNNISGNIIDINGTRWLCINK